MSDLSKLQQIANQTNVLIRVKTVFPFQIFPGFLTVEKTKVVIAQYHILGKTFDNILIEDISSVMLGTNLWLASVEISSKAFQPGSLTINNLPIKQAQEAVNIIQGLMASSQAEINVTNIPNEKLMPAIEEIGNSNDSDGEELL